MRQQRWLEFLAPYDLDILYTHGKGNRGADALIRTQQAVVSMMMSEWNYFSIKFIGRFGILRFIELYLIPFKD